LQCGLDGRFLKDAPLLLLDEATSHLDDETESVVLDALARLGRGRTVLVIAHRPELAGRADLVAVMESGRVVATGAPGALERAAS
jgi:ABC-type multidrug transport system fused ATPase/permease subunit